MKVYDSVWREGVYNILTYFGVPMKVSLIKMRLNEMYSKVRRAKNLQVFQHQMV
jgi:hypothetical protein